MQDAPVEKLYRQANLLALFTIFYNIIEGVASVWFGASDETLSLFGFGVDSFIEVVSAIGVWHMLRRIRMNEGETRDEFERAALRITGWCFHILAGALLLTAAVNFSLQHKPQTTVWGIIISCLSMSFMWFLIHFKTRIGHALGSAALLADAACSKACLYLSLVLLAASLGYELTGIGSLDSLGALAIGYLAYSEGKEALQKARGLGCGCCSCTDSDKER
ncbi:hypothetical protein LPW11_03230 [Geomonas sp. RF6]|uniref:cation transporter n=1 Tax=Geomonas sp. RF6 TaxID=2897342 RepID=UPI001E37495C|nr:cation transporter [Geomonas sp. RF6]UFS71211.1 hypothetical protein LPW11_03230 [Geomonas sp. RF6]